MNHNLIKILKIGEIKKLLTSKNSYNVEKHYWLINSFSPKYFLLGLT